MRYLYRSYCLKEGGIWSGRLRAQRWKQKLLIQRGTNERESEKRREVDRKKAEGGMSQELGLIVISGEAGLREGAGLHGWTHLSLRYLHILAKEYYKAGAERALPISWWRAERPPLPQASARATGRWVSWGWPACRTSGAAPSPSCWGPQRPCRWHRSCRSCHSPEQL